MLNKICLFESCTFTLWYSLSYLKVLKKNSFNSWQYKRVCSPESGLRQKGHLSSEANLCFSNSFFVVIILCTTLKVKCLSLLSFEDLYIFTKHSPQSGRSEKIFSKPLLRRVPKLVSRWTDYNNFYSGIWLRLLFYLPSDSTLKLLREDQEPWNQMPFVSNPEEWQQLIETSANS